MKLLITGFDPFGKATINPAWEAVKLLPSQIEDIEITKLEIPTVFKKSVEVIVEKAKECKPDIILCVGQAGGRSAITVERVAINCDDAIMPDNEDNQPIDIKVYEDGDKAYFSNLPIKAMIEEIRAEDIKAFVSNSAGTYVCNNTMYGVLYNIEKLNIAKKGGFIHVPLIPEQTVGYKDYPSMELPIIAKALEAAIRAISKYDVDIKVAGGTLH